MKGESKDLAIEIERLEREWTEMLQNVKPPQTDEFHMQCIYRVPPNIRESNPKAYTPQVLSIGPYHHKPCDLSKEDNSFKAMEELKLKYLKAFLDRTQLPIKEFVLKIKEMEESNIIRSCYADAIKCNSDDFLKMILVDACFIIELFLRWNSNSEWKGKDPLMLKPWMLTYVDLDLLLLENQLPFCVLEKLHKLTGMNEKFLDITFKYFGNRLFGNECSGESPKHFNDLLRSSIISSSKLGLGKPEECKQIIKHVYSASQLMEAGLEFKLSPNNSLLDLTYSKYGVLSMPSLDIHDNSEVLFRNMMAYEHCHLSATSIVTQYLAILDFLINTEKDVNIYLLIRKLLLIGPVMLIKWLQ